MQFTTKNSRIETEENIQDRMRIYYKRKSQKCEFGIYVHMKRSFLIYVTRIYAINSLLLYYYRLYEHSGFFGLSKVYSMY